MMAATYSLLFLAPLALFYFSGASAAFRPSAEVFHKHEKKYFFVREKAGTGNTLSTTCNDFLTLFRRGGKKDISCITPTTSKPRSKSILLASAKDESLTAETETDTIMHPIISFIGGTTSFVVATSFFIALAYFRDATMTSFWVGAICNAILSKVLKKMINQSRPPELETAEMAVVPSDGGMPSSHAMSLAFIGTFTALLLPNTAGAMTWAVAMRLTLVVYAAISLFYRVQVKFHTWEQIAVGVAVGTCNAGLFYFFLEPSLNTWISANILNDHGLLPVPMLLIPIIVGLLVVGSVERRIAKWFN